MRKPSVHLNGTSRGALSEGYEDASRAVHRALQALVECCPNARDYYVQDDRAFEEARDEHQARIDKLQSVIRDIAELLHHVEGAP